jgi:hypothetical protein
MGMLKVALDPATVVVVVAVDPGKLMNRVWVSNGTGLLEEPVSLPVARSTLDVAADRARAVVSGVANVSRWLPTAQRSSAAGGEQVHVAGESHGHRYDTAAPPRQHRHTPVVLVHDGTPRVPGIAAGLRLGGHAEVSVHVELADERPAAR